VRREPHDKRFEAVRPNHLWHVDFVQRYIHRASTFTLIFIDDYSRFVVGHAVDDTERAATVIAAFEEAVLRHGKPERVMHDRGGAFWSWRGISKYTALLTELLRDRLDARDRLLQPLVDERDEIRRGDFNDALRAFVDRALEAARTIDRYFWLDAAADLIAIFPDDERPDLFRSAARRIHANFRCPRRERSAAERFLVRRLWTLA
jgi:hypothetical protein